MTLHLVNKSPFSGNHLMRCLAALGTDSGLLLIEDAVYAADAGGGFAECLAALDGGIRIFALGPDLSARGIPPDQTIPGIEIIDYRGFVRLAVAYDKVVSW